MTVQTREERMKLVKPELLSKALVEQKLFENEGHLLEAIKNEFTIPRFILSLEEENKLMKEKMKTKELKDDDKSMNEIISAIKANSVKIWQLEGEMEANIKNIEVYQEWIEYLKSLLD